MRACGAVLSAALLAVLVRAATSSETTSMEEKAGDELEDDADSAPFAIVVEHGGGRRCGGALVSLRTALTSAWCARGEHGGAARSLAALWPGVRGARRRVARVALAEGGSGELGEGGEGTLAVLELEAPFGAECPARPILMARRAAECAAPAQCYVVRAEGATPRLRVLDVAVVGCVRGGAGGALCLAGPTLCASERGAGVVCGGKLCGVVAGGGGCSAASRATPLTPHRRFLHCAHTLRACGSGGECADLCSEHQLIEHTTRAASASHTAPPHHHHSTQRDTAPPHRQEPRYLHTHTATRSAARPTHTAPTATRTTARGTAQPPTATSAVTPPPPHHSQHSPAQPSFEFEPNRADFRAGEYGDNAAEYGGEEGAPRLPPTAPPTPPPPLPTARFSEVAAQRAGDSATRGPSAPSAAPPAAALAPLALLVYAIIYVC